VLILLAFALARPAPAAEVYVQQDATPLVSKPGIGGKIRTWVDTGFPLIVIGIEGDWLKVASPRLKLPVGDLWVPVARVGSSVPGQIDVALRGEAPPMEAFGPGFRLRAEGTPHTGFRVACHIVSGDHDSYFVVADHVPADIDLGGDAVDCAIDQLGRGGRLQVALLGGDGSIIATTSPIALHRSARLRSDGPWGGAYGLQGPAGFSGFGQMPVAFRHRRADAIVPPLMNAVPPLGNPVPALGNPVPMLGNPVPLPGNPVPPFARSPVPMQ